jgi:hypothetical protein
MSIGPSRPLVLEKPDAIDLQQAARYFGQRGPADEATASLLERCAVPILAAATPRGRKLFRFLHFFSSLKKSAFFERRNYLLQFWHTLKVKNA